MINLNKFFILMILCIACCSNENKQADVAWGNSPYYIVLEVNEETRINSIKVNNKFDRDGSGKTMEDFLSLVKPKIVTIKTKEHELYGKLQKVWDLLAKYHVKQAIVYIDNKQIGSYRISEGVFENNIPKTEKMRLFSHDKSCDLTNISKNIHIYMYANPNAKISFVQKRLKCASGYKLDLRWSFH